jgi:hypothetical protein
MKDFLQVMIKHQKYARFFEPMLDYKYSTIALGATPIESVGPATDEVVLWLRQKKGSTFTSIRRANYASTIKSRTPTILGTPTAKQGTQ